MENEAFQTEHCRALLGCTGMSTGVGRPLEGAAAVSPPQFIHHLFQAHLLSLTAAARCSLAEVQEEASPISRVLRTL